jgi:hypothetical protein
MKLRTLALLAAGALLPACTTAQPASQPMSIPPAASSSGLLPLVKADRGICYGTLGVEATPCPVKLKKKNDGTVIVTVGGPGVVIATPIASDCAGSGSVCDVSRDGSQLTQFVISSTKGENVCGKAYVVFEGLTASESPIGTATVEVINRYC